MSNSEVKWYFPSNNFGASNGLDTADVEIFKKDPDGSLAREVCQNSIDARDDKVNGTLKVEFKTFALKTEQIPGIELLRKEIKRCFLFSKEKGHKDEKAFRKMVEIIDADMMTCLRISDFNTTGLSGIKEGRRNTPFFNLTKGSGNCNKGAGSGGSKGIGKFAAFVASGINTVFYSTHTVSGEKGYIGISKLASRPMSMEKYGVDYYYPEIDANDTGESTQGNGYYSTSERHIAVLEDLILDNNFERGSASGTDIYILGFNDEKDWEFRIIAKVLDSFMGAFLLTDFEVVVEEKIINRNSIATIINDKNFLDACEDRLSKSIKAQYELLLNMNENFRRINIEGLGDINLCVKTYSHNERNSATKKCDYIRYPYMKIKDYRKRSVLDYSAVCVIENNDLNNFLREIENPEHTDWQIERLNYDKDKYNQARNVIKKLKKAISEYIDEKLMTDLGEQVDATVASDLVPDLSNEELQGSGDNNEKSTIGNNATQVVGQLKPVNKVKTISDLGKTVANIEKDDGGSSSNSNIGNNSESGDGEKRINHDDGKKEVENNETGKKTLLSEIKYKYIYNNKTKMYDIIFISPYNEENCRIIVEACGSGSDKYKVKIDKAYIDGNECNIKKGEIRDLQLKIGKSYKISYMAANMRKVAVEVKVYAIR